MSAKRVFILGAGFSKQAGMPLAIELTPLIINKFKEDDLEEALSWFEWLKQRIEWLEAGGGALSMFIVPCRDGRRGSARARLLPPRPSSPRRDRRVA